MAHWGVAISLYHQIWDRRTMPRSLRDGAKCKRRWHTRRKSAREREYVAALSDFYKPRPARLSGSVGRTPPRWASSIRITPAIRMRARSTRCRSWRRRRPMTTADAESQRMAVLTPLFAQFSRSSRRGALHHSRLRYPGAGPGRTCGSQALRRNCRLRTARGSYAGPHLRAPRIGRPTSMPTSVRWPPRTPPKAESKPAPWISSIRTISWCTPTCRAVKRLGQSRT